jgi:di/tricarboxylate transporter
MAVLTGTNCAFLSPVANAANAMVVGPGSYRFRDFLRAGLPLTFLIVVLAGVLIPVFWPL